MSLRRIDHLHSDIALDPNIPCIDDEGPNEDSDDEQQGPAPARVVHDGEDMQKCHTVRLPPDVMSVTLSTLIRDLSWLMHKDRSSHILLRLWRLFFTIALLYFTFILQLWLIFVILEMVVDGATHDVQTHYSMYESHMYHNHTESWFDGRLLLGIPGYYDYGQFDTLAASIKEVICYIPLSAMPLLAPVLFVWALVVMGSMRGDFDVLIPVLTHTKTQECSMEDAIRRPKDKHLDVIICSLPLHLKVFIVLFVLLPRCCVSIGILFLGCNWLTATTNFNEVLINGVALGFINELGVILWVVVPKRMQEEAHGTLVLPPTRYDEPSFTSFFYAFIVILFAGAFTVVYLCGMQTVLPGYRWDVTEACRSYLQTSILPFD